MILFCDTSSLVKLYIDEAYADTVRLWVAESDMVATCRVALPEMISALTRRLHRRDLDQSLYQQLLTAIRTDWQHLVVLDFDERLAADLAERHALRGFDAVHLAAVLHLARLEKIAPTFTSFDDHLNRAAAAEGLRVLSASPSAVST